MTKRKLSTAKSKQRQPGWFSSFSPTVLDLLCVALLYAITLILFREIVFENAVFSDESDTANAYSNKQVGDRIRDTEGVDPLWSPYAFSGMPTFGNVTYVPHNVSYIESIGKPLLKLLFLFSTGSWFVAHYFLGGVFMFFLLRLWKFGRSASLIAALTFMLSPYAVALGSAGHGSKLYALSYLPLVFLLTHLLYERRDILSFGLLSAGIGSLLLTNHVQIVYYVLIVIGLYSIYHVIIDMKENPSFIPKKIGLFVGALAIGLCISSYVYLSVYEYSQYSIRGGGTAGATGGLTWDYATNWSMPPIELFTLLIPSLFGLQSPYYWGSMPFTSSTIYVGILPVVLSIIALAYRRNRLTIFLSILAIIVMLMSFGKHFALLYEILFNILPFFNKFRAPSTILHLLPFIFGLLSAYGLTAVLELRQESGKADKLKRILLIALGILISILILGTLFKSALFESLSDFMFVKEGETQQYQQQYGQQTPQIIDQLKQIRFFGNENFGGLWTDYVHFSLLTIAVVGLLVLFLRNTITQTTLAAGLIALLVIDLMMINSRFINPVPARGLEDRFKPDPTVSFLKQQTGLFRALPLGGNLFMDNSFAHHGIQSVGGYSPAKLKIYQTMIDSCLYVSSDPILPLNMNVVNMLNTRYIVTQFRLPEDRFQLVHADEARRKLTFANPAALPRAFFVKEVVAAQSEHDVFTGMNSSSFDAATTAILEKELPEQVFAPESTNVEIIEFNSRRIVIKAYSSTTALLVISEIYYPAGWHATIDGKSKEIFKTNYVLRSVLVPPGEHEIVLTFEPSSYSTGWLVSHAGWAVTAICIVGGLWKIPTVRERLSKFRGLLRKDS